MKKQPLLIQRHLEKNIESTNDDGRQGLGPGRIPFSSPSKLKHMYRLIKVAA